MQGFVAQLKDINALAERSPGFVWRLQTSEGDATGIRGFDAQVGKNLIYITQRGQRESSVHS